MFSELLTPQVGFALGLMLHACVKIVSKKDRSWDWWQFLLLFPLAFFLTWWLRRDYYQTLDIFHLSNYFLIFAAIFCAAAGIIFRKQVFVQINELVLMVWNLGLLYLAITIFGFEPIILVPLALFLLSFFVSLFHIKINRGMQIAMYVWFLLLGIYISAALIPWKEIFAAHSLSQFGFLQMFFLGMGTFYTYSSLIFLFYLFFHPHEGISSKNKPDTIEFLHEQFDAKQFHPFATTAVLFFLAAIFCSNYQFGFAPDEALLAMVFGASPYLGEQTHAFFHGQIDEYHT